MYRQLTGPGVLDSSSGETGDCVPGAASCLIPYVLKVIKVLMRYYREWLRRRASISTTLLHSLEEELQAGNGAAQVVELVRAIFDSGDDSVDDFC